MNTSTLIAIILPTIISSICFIILVTIHNVVQIRLAERFGDFSAKSEGTNTWNPLVHLDLLGSLLFLSTSLSFLGSGMGWGKSVIINEYNFEKPKFQKILVHLAGIGVYLTATLISFIFLCIIIKVTGNMSIASGTTATSALQTSIILLSVLGTSAQLLILDLLPFPPFDSYGIVSEILPQFLLPFTEPLEMYAPWIIALILSPIIPVGTIIHLFFNSFVAYLLSAIIGW